MRGDVVAFGVLLAGCVEPETDALSLEILSEGAFRDLRATPSRPASVVWAREGSPEVFADRVPARQVRPGQRWVATATDAIASTSRTIEIPDPPGGNVLIVLFDDIGVDHVGAYGLNPLAPPTPVLDGLAAQGVRFDRAYASPVCSPTRGILLTGRHARRTGLGWIADTGSRDFALPLASLTLAEALDHAWPAPWATSAVGKWHVAGPQAQGVLTHPLDQGFDWFSGSVGNPSYQEGRGYDDWDKNTNGVAGVSTTYTTTDSVDDAIARAQGMPEPWLLYVALHAAHTPLTPPPADLITAQVAEDDDQDTLFDATVEAMDTEIGRMLDTLGPDLLSRTTLIVAGDNGSPEHAVDPPLEPLEAKHTVFEGGVRVPLIVTGPHVAVPGSASDALIHIADLFATTLHIAGVPLTDRPGGLSVDVEEPIAIDGLSLLPMLADPRRTGRASVFVEAFFPNGGPPPVEGGILRRSLIGPRFKLLRNGDSELFFDLGDGVQIDDGEPLLPPLAPDAAAAYGQLRWELDQIEQTLSFEGF